MSALPEFPFTAVSGQDAYQLALQLVVVDPAIGGVLVSGPRGTGKSTLARGLAEVAPNRPEFVNLPLGATEEMLVGTLNLQKALGEQDVEFRPGLLARAHGGVLYVDEINLLPDHLVDLLLDVAASGVNHVERDGISHRHAARFVLLGTMNPDEGELRPQLLDRFGLAVSMNNDFDAQTRVRIVQAREAFERDSAAFCREQEAEQQQLRTRLEQALARRGAVECSDAMRFDIAQRCIDAGVDGLRADIVWTRAATAHAALRGAESVEAADLDAVADLVLRHRRKNAPPDAGQTPSGRQSGGSERDHTEAGGDGDWGQMRPVAQATAGQTRFAMPQSSAMHTPMQPGADRVTARGAGPRGEWGRATREPGHRINWFGTLAANLGRWPLSRLRFHYRRGGDPVLHLVMLDTSASVLRDNRFADAKAAILRIAEQAYLRREQLGILGFGNQRVQTLLPRRRAPKALRRLLDEIEAGGGTPLRQVVEAAQNYQRQLRVAQPGLRCRNYLITDGKSSASLAGLELDGETWLVDIESSRVHRGRGREFAEMLGARYWPLPV